MNIIIFQGLISMSKKFVITGGAGFIGSNLAEALANENEVVVIDDLSTGMAENLAGLEVQLLRGCITDLGLLKNAFEGADCIFHQAGIASVKKSIEDPVRTDEVGIEGTLKVLIAAKDAGVRRVILASSAAVYGSSPELLKKEDMMPEPKSPYAVTKLAGEHYARIFRELYGLETVALRYFNVFGPKQDPSSEYSGVISRFISFLLQGEQPIIYGDGQQTHDFVYVADVVKANILASRCSLLGVLNIACGKSISLNTLAATIGKILQMEVRPRYEAPRAGDIRHSLADISRARSMGYAPDYSIEDGLRETIRWYRR
ncbi:L-arabinose 1-dehydrogenase (NAD(P)(+)) [uncultured archaeon]|nr:L-arabinose 1-dehydrogenase (NAD(P)(+)) [uncultured archaeon]